MVDSHGHGCTYWYRYDLGSGHSGKHSDSDDFSPWACAVGVDVIENLGSLWYEL